MKPLARSIFLLGVLEIIILSAGFLITLLSERFPDFSEILTASAVFTMISLVLLVIFFRGQQKETASQTMHTLTGMGIKFLAELVFAFLWFFTAKKTGISSVVLFFVLYLTFTLFSVLIILKTLKSKTLE